MTSERFDAAIEAIDAANAVDPITITIDGSVEPKELAHARRATEWVQRLRPGASEELLLATRGHHLRRWTSPRSNYPEGRAGYLRWRRDLHTQHARELGEILSAAGYDDKTIERVGAIVSKRRLRDDPEVQTFEDALCLVFLETQVDDVSDRLPSDKMRDVLRKTAAKMSPDGLQAARTLALSDDVRTALETDDEES